MELFFRDGTGRATPAARRFAASLQSNTSSQCHLTLRLWKQLGEDFDAGLPREQSEAAALYEQSYKQYHRLNYIYENLPQIKPEGWEWQL